MFLILFALIFLINANHNTYALEEIYLESEKGIEYFKETQNIYNLKLMNNFVTQDTQTYCGVASTAIVLNSLGIKTISDPNLAPHKYFTQHALMMEEHRPKTISKANVKKAGMSLAKIKVLIAAHATKVKAIPANKINLEKFKKYLIQLQEQSRHYMIVQFDRKVLGQKKRGGGGHFSPVAAYHKKSGYVLVLDVSRYKTGPYWVKDEALWSAINTYDKDEKQYRGIILIDK